MELAFGGMAIASAFHAAEEYIYPGGFLRWLRSVFPRSAPGVGQAMVINGAFFALVLSPFYSDPRVTPVFTMSIAGLLLANGACHIAGTWLTGRYSPGTVTSVLCYFPASIYTIVTISENWRMGADQIIAGLLLGGVWQAIPLAIMMLRR